MKEFLLIFFTLVFSSEIYAQNLKLSGTVYDYFSKQPLEAVTVQSSSGSHAITDSAGKFSIPVEKKDSVWFSYLSKKTFKYLVDTIANLTNFEIALYVDANWLPEVKVRNPNYRLDSLQNRQEYAKIFNFRKPGIRLSAPSASSYVPGSVTVGIDLDELINMFRFRRNRQIQSMQDRLIREEEDKYINHRFSKNFVQKLVPLRGDTLNSFMQASRPSYDLLVAMNDLELGYYIQQMYKLYESKEAAGSSFFLRREEE